MRFVRDLLDLRLARDELAVTTCADIDPGQEGTCWYVPRPATKGGIYAGVESVEMCYSFSEHAGLLVRSMLSGIKFIDTLDYQFARLDVPDMYKSDSGTIYHLPLWKHNLLPNKFFDVILCNYILDELSPDDFTRVLAIIQRCLADEGVLYCRGSQQRAMMGSVYLFGYSRFHGMDITRNLLARDLRVHEGRFRISTYSQIRRAHCPNVWCRRPIQHLHQRWRACGRGAEGLRPSRCTLAVPDASWGDEGHGIFDHSPVS